MSISRGHVGLWYEACASQCCFRPPVNQAVADIWGLNEKHFLKHTLLEEEPRLRLPRDSRTHRLMLTRIAKPGAMWGVRGVHISGSFIDGSDYRKKGFSRLAWVLVRQDFLSIGAMVHVQFNSELLTTLRDKVVVLTGGATGIGRSTVIQFAGEQPSIPCLHSLASNLAARCRMQSRVWRHQ